MRILLVEDEVLIGETMMETLTDAGHDVVLAVTGDAAVEIIRVASVPFEALVTDFHMPGKMNGLDVAGCIRERSPSLPVIIVSGQPQGFHATWHHEAGYVLLRKPYGAEGLLRALRESDAEEGASVKG